MLFRSTISLLSLALSASAAHINSDLIKRDVTIPSYVSNFKGTTYTPYDENYNCRTEAQIKTDISALKSFSVIRLYSNGCSVVQYALEAMDVSNQKLIVAVNSITSSDTIQEDLNSIETSVGLAGYEFNNVVDTVVVGNELVYNGWATAAQVGQYIQWARDHLTTFPGKIITCDTVSSFYGNPELCEYVDYIGTNSHPYFDNSTAANAGEYVLSHIQAVWSFCNEQGHAKDVVVMETGWPWKGDTYNNAVPGVEEQKTALKAINEAAGSACIGFSAYNELWKDEGNWKVERNFGFLGNAPSTA